MIFPLYIAKRYFVGRKFTNIINIISLIAIVGVAGCSMALIVVLSAFNGIENIVISLFNAFDPEIKITAAEGKVFESDSDQIKKLRAIPGVVWFAEVIEENALLKHKDKQYIVTIKGVDDEFVKMSRLDTMLADGSFQLKQGEVPYTVVGQGVAISLGIGLSQEYSPIFAYVPKRSKKAILNPEQAFRTLPIYPSGVFSIQHDFDSKYIIVPIEFARELLDYTTELSAIEIGIDKNADPEVIQEQMQNVLGSKYLVKTRYEQHDSLYRIMQSEKMGVFLILTFILIIAVFNVIGSLTMLVIDKKNDIIILGNIGAEPSQIKQIFFFQGVLITITGSLVGLGLGLVLCLLQQKFGFVKIPGSFVMESYPVALEAGDFIKVFLTVLLIGIIASIIPTRLVAAKYLKNKALAL